MTSYGDPIDADLSNADWPKRTKDTMEDLLAAIAAKPPGRQFIHGDGWYCWLDFETVEWDTDDEDKSPIVMIRDGFPQQEIQKYVDSGKTAADLYADVIEFLKKWGVGSAIEQRGSAPPEDIERRGRLGGMKMKKRPKMGSPRGPILMGAFAGCGTGAGGFKPGNTCGKEDGIPQSPKLPTARKLQAEKEAIEAKIAADKAKSEAKRKAKEAADKEKSIQLKREKAAIRRQQRKLEKSRRKKEAAEKAAKKAELLAKASEPKGHEYGTFEKLEKLPGETAVEFAVRSMKKDIDAAHASLHDIDMKSKSTAAELGKAHEAALAEYKEKTAEWLREQHKKEPSQEDVDHELIFIEPAYRPQHLVEAERKVEAARKAIRSHRRAVAREYHEVVARLTSAHGGGRSGVPLEDSAYPEVVRPKKMKPLDGVGSRSRGRQFLADVVPSIHKKTIMTAKQKLTGGGNGSYESKTHSVKYPAEDDSTMVHEYGHAIETKRSSTLEALAEDYKKRLSSFFAENPNSGLVRHPIVRYYDGPERARPDGRKPLRSGYRSHSSVLGYVSRYSDFGYDAATRASHGGDSRYLSGTEVFSTGLQAMYDNPVDFRTRARDHFNLTLVVLAGRL